jgi:hypothetical protein
MYYRVTHRLGKVGTIYRSAVTFPFRAICIVALLSIMRMDGIVGRHCVDSRHCLVLRYVML